MDRKDVTCFNREEPFSIVGKATPHWVQSGCVVFITWRLKDSLPARVIQRIDNEVKQLVDRSKNEKSLDLREEADLVGMTPQALIGWKTFHLYERYVDEGLGSCVLKQPSLRQIVFDSLLKFDQDRYYLSDFVIMPNHLHMLVAFPNEEDLLRQSEAWKRYTGRQINKELGRSGDFWMPGQFDHLVRSEKQFEYLRDYIANNPTSAKLRPSEFTLFRK